MATEFPRMLISTANLLRVFADRIHADGEGPVSESYDSYGYSSSMNEQQHQNWEEGLAPINNRTTNYL